MKERPILFSPPMVRAILDGRKTQTRRVYVPRECEPYEIMGELMDGPNAGKRWPHWFSPEVGPEYCPVSCKYGQAGDRLWVKETWAPVLKDPVPSERAWWPGRQPWPGIPGDRYSQEIPEGETPQHRYNRVIYRADGEMPGGFKEPWTSPLFMKRWASRITLEITDVRVERLQNISEADARAEGCIRNQLSMAIGAGGERPSTHRGDFASLWSSINGEDGPKSWDANPWVWVIEFRRLEAVE